MKIKNFKVKLNLMFVDPRVIEKDEKNLKILLIKNENNKSNIFVENPIFVSSDNYNISSEFEMGIDISEKSRDFIILGFLNKE